MAAPPSMRVGLLVLGLGALAAPQARLFLALLDIATKSEESSGYRAKADLGSG